MQEGGEMRWEGLNGSEKRQGMNVSIRSIVRILHALNEAKRSRLRPHFLGVYQHD